MERYTIWWTTGDSDRGLTAGELRRLVADLGFQWVGNQVKDGERVCGRVSRDDN